MPSIPRDFVNDLMSRTNILDVISPFVQLKKAGKEYKACCPFHNEKTPSFTVSVEKNFYHCFGCQKSGDALQFMMDYNKLTYVEAITELAKQHGLTVPVEEDGKPRENLQPLYELNQLAATFFQEQLHQNPNAGEIQKYCRKRGLTQEIVAQYGIGFAPPGWENVLTHATGHQFSIEQCVKVGLAVQKSENKVYDRFRNRLMFPIRDQRGRVIGFGGRAIHPDDEPKYLNSPETPLFHKGSHLYGLWEANQHGDHKGLILVEGYMDVVALAQFDIHGAVATLGTATTKEHIEKCFRFNPHLYFCFDGDNAGKKAAWRACETALSCLKQGKSIRFMFLPQDEDPDSFVRKVGTPAFIQRLDDAKPLTDFFFEHLTRDLDLKQLDQKAELANCASPLIKQIPDAILRELMFNTLAQMVQLPLHVLKEISTEQTLPNQGVKIASPRLTTEKSKANWKQSTIQKMMTPMRLAISLLVQHPELAKDTPDLSYFNQATVPGTQLLLQCVAFIKQKNITSTGELLLRWDDDTSLKHLKKCAELQHCIPVAGISDEYLGALARIREQDTLTQIDSLMSKAKHSGLSEEEKHQLHQLITASKPA